MRRGDGPGIHGPRVAFGVVRGEVRAMPRHDARSAEAAIAQLLDAFAADPHLRAELQRARRQWFGAGDDGSETVVGNPGAAELRFGEWFALERESEILGAVPIEVPRFAGDAAVLGGSSVAVLLVTTASDGHVEAEDLQDGEVLDLAVPPGSLRSGDLVVGRVFPNPEGEWTPSTAAAVFRPGRELGDAFRRDVEAVGLDRRLWQIELEHLLLRRPDQAPSPTAGDRGRRGAAADRPPLEHLEARLAALLEPTGGKHSADTVSQRLAEADRPGPVMGPLLDELAFDTNVDLDALRRVLLEIWNARHADAGVAEIPPAAASGETLGEQLVRTLDDGLRRKRDVDDLFAQLERMAGLEPGAADDGDNPFDHDDDPSDDAEPVGGDAATGDLGPLVEEYLWETRRGREPGAGALRLLVELQGNAAHARTDVEAVTATDLMRLLLHCYLGAAPVTRASTVRDAWLEVQRFYDWVHETQEIDPGNAVRDCKGRLVDEVDRLQAAGVALSTPDQGRARPGIVEVDAVRADGFGVRDDDGGHHWITAPNTTTALLRVGDLLLGALQGDERERSLCGMVVALPADARALME